jgi:hypothetical protein
VQDKEGRKHAACEVFSNEPTAAPPPTDLLVLMPQVPTETTKTLERVDMEKLALAADKASYRIGDTASLTLTCPFAPCDGTMPLCLSALVNVIFCEALNLCSLNSRGHRPLPRYHQDAHRSHQQRHRKYALCPFTRA